MLFKRRSSQYQPILKKRSLKKYSYQDNKFIIEIKKNTVKYNVDNVARTNAYGMFYEKNKEMKWAFLASMVSRNAGWNMTDLWNKWYVLALEIEIRRLFFLTFERANWIIFQDAYPQLLIYELSKKLNKPMFHLLKAFNVSVFMEYEWNIFWEYRDYERIMYSLIINEQNMIQQPVIKNKIFQKKVFNSLPYKLQELGHFSCVIFPTLQGKLYGSSVHGFEKIDNRINLGKRLAAILFSEEHYHSFYHFSKKIEHTGSRYDYEKFIHPRFTRETPFLRSCYPFIHHEKLVEEDWLWKNERKVKKWGRGIPCEEIQEMTKWFLHKQHQMHGLIALNHWVIKQE